MRRTAQSLPVFWHSRRLPFYLSGIVWSPCLQVVLSCTQDDFFARNRFSNFGDLGVAVKSLMDDYQKATRLNENINSIEDMQAFLER